MMAVGAPPVPGQWLRHLADRVAALPRCRRWAGLASVVWATLVLGYGIGYLGVLAPLQPPGMVFLDILLLLVALVLPLILLWLAALVAEELERQREVIAALAEVAAPLIEALESTRATLRSQGPVAPEEIRQAVHAALAGMGRGSDLAAPLDRAIAGQVRMQRALDELLARTAPPAPRRSEPEPPAAPAAAVAPAPVPAPAVAPGPADQQPALPNLPGIDLPAPPDWPGLVRALDFPRDAEDQEGFRALRAALRHHGLAQMLQAAEDVLTLLAQDGIYVDDLVVAPPDPEHWRRFIRGARGAAVAGVGGIRDEAVLQKARRLMKTDPIFRDTALFFHRRFDAVLVEFAADAGDAELASLADTRSGRAFMLLARLSGSFD
jgi:hypothetical protein